jgi:hypothetical protein
MSCLFTTASCSCCWSYKMHQIGQAFYSLYPIALSNLQGEAMIIQRITFFTDDDALVDIIIKLFAGFHFGIRLLWYLYVNWFNSIKYIFTSYSRHISGLSESVSGNPVSRIQVSTLRQLASANVHSSPTVIPDYHIYNLNSRF